MAETIPLAEKKKRSPLDILITALCVAMGAFHLYTAFFGVLTAMWQRSIHLSFALVICYLLAFQKTEKVWKKILYAVFCLLATAWSVYIVLGFDGIIERYGNPNQTDLIMGGVIIALVLIFTFRQAGKILPGIAIVFLLYALFGSYLPGILNHRGYDLPRIINQMALSTEGIFGTSLGVSATYIFLFMLFGALLTSTNIGQFYIDFAVKALGKSPGGPAKAAVVSSCLFGSVSGSAVANVVGTGVVTIPLMKGIGYTPAFAGAVEAVASTGGQIMPPMMGAGAFIMAEILGVPYYQVAIGALIPALIYYGSVFAMVHFRARAYGLNGIDTSSLPSIKSMMKSKGIFVLPLIALIVFLVVLQMSAMRAAVYSIIITVLIGIIFSKTTLAEFIDSFVQAAKSSFVVIASTACAGIIVSVINLTGLGLKFSNSMIQVAGSSMFLVLVMLMIASLILGMGLPTTPAYLILAVLGAPTLIRLGADPMAAHMFVFYFGAVSMITPPVAMAVYAATSIAESKFWPTAGYSVLLGIPAFIVPYLFVMEPSMLFRGDLVTALIAGITGVFGSIFLSAGINGWLFCRAAWPMRIILMVGGLMLIMPWTWVSIAGIAVVAVAILFQWSHHRKETLSTAS